MKNDNTMGTALPNNQAWKLRFWTIFFGQSTSLIGSAITQFALIWWITEKSTNTTELAIASICGLLPQALLGPLGGALADRYNRRFIMIISDLFNATVMCVLSIMYYYEATSFATLYMVIALISASSAFQIPAAMASTSMLVPEKHLSLVSGARQILGGALIVLSAPLGATLMNVLPMYWVLSIDILTMILGITPLLFFRIPQTISKKKMNVIHQLKEAGNLIWKNPGMKGVFIVSTVATIALTPLTSLLPLLVKNHFNGEASHLAYFRSIAGIGYILGGGVVMSFKPTRCIRWTICSYVIACALISGVASIPSDYVMFGAVLWGLSNCTFVIGGSAFSVFLQATIPNQYLGRVFSLLSTMTALSAPLGLILFSPIANHIGVKWIFVLLGILSAFIVSSSIFSKSILALDEKAFGGHDTQSIQARSIKPTKNTS